MARFEVEKARVCCAQENSTPTLVSTKPTRLTVEERIVAVCRSCVRQLKESDVTWSYYLVYWASYVHARNVLTYREMRIRLRQSTEVAEDDSGERFIGWIGGLGGAWSAPLSRLNAAHAVLYACPNLN